MGQVRLQNGWRMLCCPKHSMIGWVRGLWGNGVGSRVGELKALAWVGDSLWATLPGEWLLHLPLHRVVKLKTPRELPLLVFMPLYWSEERRSGGCYMCAHVCLDHSAPAVEALQVEVASNSISSLQQRAVSTAVTRVFWPSGPSIRSWKAEEWGKDRSRRGVDLVMLAPCALQYSLLMKKDANGVFFCQAQLPVGGGAATRQTHTCLSTGHDGT